MRLKTIAGLAVAAAVTLSAASARAGIDSQGLPFTNLAKVNVLEYLPLSSTIWNAKTVLYVMPVGNMASATVMPVGGVLSASTYVVLVANTATDLTPNTLSGATHVRVNNVGGADIWLGDSAVTTAIGDLLEGGLISELHGTKFGFKLYGIKSGTGTNAVRVTRW